MRDWIRLTKTLEHGTTKTTKSGFGGFGGNEPIVSFNKINEKMTDTRPIFFIIFLQNSQYLLNF